MDDIYALLKINKGVIRDFHLQASRTVDHQTELSINRSMRTLRDIEERMMSNESVKISLQTIEEIIQKVIKNAKTNNGDMDIWSIRELRIVSYYLMKLQGNVDAYKYALNILDANWRDMFYNGLSFYCLDTWNMIEPDLRILTCELLTKKLKQYKGNNKKYMVMKNHANLFDEAGPLRMSALLSQKKQDIIEAPNYFCNKQSTISQSYYSDVIIGFFETNKIIDLNYVEEIFCIHNNDRTKKLIFADLVARVDALGDELKRTQLCKFANRILGDITLSSTWAPFIGATNKDAQKLKKAKQLVNLWFNRKIIETFFEVCVQDRERKMFWLNYVGYVSSFKIVGSSATKRLLQGDNRVSGIFSPHFIETDSRHSQTSALVLFIKNKMIVEFSDKGAVYVYNQNHAKAKKVIEKKWSITSISDLKVTSMSNLVDTGDWFAPNNEEGRMSHIGYWQDRLNGWMHDKVISSTNVGLSFSDTVDNDVFRAKPLPTEEIRLVTQTNMTQKTHDLPNAKQAKNKNEKVDMSLSQKAKQVVYEKNVSYLISSKKIANDRCCIVCNRRGFYVYIAFGERFVHIRPLIEGAIPEGSIWIKRPDSNGWQEIIHSTSHKYMTVGFVKQGGPAILYKEELIQTDFMTIKLY